MWEIVGLQEGERESAGKEKRDGEKSHCFLFFQFQYELAIITADGAEILGPLTQEANWDIAHYVK